MGKIDHESNIVIQHDRDRVSRRIETNINFMAGKIGQALGTTGIDHRRTHTVTQSEAHKIVAKKTRAAEHRDLHQNSPAIGSARR